MVRLSSLTNYTNSFNTDDEIIADKIVEYEAIESIDKSGKFRYRYQRIHPIINSRAITDNTMDCYMLLRTREVVDLDTFDNWIHDVISLNYRRFITPYTGNERPTMVIVHNIPLSMHLTNAAYLVRVTLPFRKYNLDYSENEYWFDLVDGIFSNEFCPWRINPSKHRQTGKSLLSKVMVDYYNRTREIPKFWAATPGHQDVVETNLSESYSKIAKTFGDMVYKPELVVNENNAGNKEKPTKVYYYTEEDLKVLPEEMKDNLVSVTLADNN